MKSPNNILGKLWSHFMNDSLRRNSTLLILAQAINAGTVFVFWVICARLFAANDVGLATAIISLGGLTAAFTNLGLPNTVIRFLPTSKHKGQIFTASLIAVSVVSIIGALVVLSIIGHISPRLTFVQDNLWLASLLILLVLGNTVSPLTDGVLMSFRKGEYILGRAIITNLPRVILPFVLAAFAISGMVSIYVGLLLLGTAYGVLMISKKLMPGVSFKPDMKEIKAHRSYALSNYLGGMLGILPSTLVPIIVLNKLGAAQAAYFYMPMQMAMFLNIISSSTSQALMSEASQLDDDATHRAHFKNAFKHLYMMLLPAVAGLCLLGWPVLRAYGQDYVQHGFVLLLLLASASIFVAVNWLGDTLLNIQKRSRAYFFMNGLNALFVIVAIWIGSAHGLTGVGLGWLIAQAASALVYVLIFARSHAARVIANAGSSLLKKKR